MKQIKWAVFIVIAMLTLQACSTPIGAGRREFQAGNYQAAFGHLLPLAKQGNAQAQYAIGYMYYNGKGVKRDFAQANYWFHKAAAQQQPKALVALDQIKTAQKSASFPTPHRIYAMQSRAEAVKQIS